MKAYKINRDFGDLGYYVYESSPDAPVLLGISGFGCTHYNYLDLIPELSKNFTIVLIDNRGMGVSSKTNLQYSLADVAEDALAVMDELKIPTFGLMGISMGGFIAQEIIKAAPERVSAIALMCTLSSGADFKKPTALTEAGLRQFHKLDPRMQAEFSTQATVHPSLMKNDKAQYQRIVNLRIENTADIEEAVKQNYAALSFLDKPLDLSSINCPVLAMAGAEDRFVNPENVQAFAKNIKQCKTHFIQEADHFFFLEKPNEVSSVLNRFFKGSLA